MKDHEIWKPIIGLEEYYEVSNHGRVRSIPRIKIDTLGRKQPIKGIILKPNLRNGRKRAFIHLWVNYKDDCRQLHRLVAEHFIGISDLPVNHKDRNTLNNHVSNLEYINYRENTNHWLYKDKSNLRGVTVQNGRFRAKIYINGKTKHLGYFDTEKEAHQAYLNAVIGLGESKYATSN